MSQLIKGAIIGGIILFVWTAISWMVLPWHMPTFHAFKDAAAVANVIASNAASSGIYFIPTIGQTAPAGTPMVFASVQLPGMGSMGSGMVIGLIMQIVLAFLVTWLLTKTRVTTYWGKVGFVLLFAVTAALLANVPYWNWYAFSASYTVVMIVDTIIGWFLAGLALAKIVK